MELELKRYKYIGNKNSILWWENILFMSMFDKQYM